MTNRIIIIWAILIAITLASFSVVETAGLGRPVTISIIFILAFIKVRIVGLEYMELRHAPPVMRWIFELWCVLICGALIFAILA